MADDGATLAIVIVAVLVITFFLVWFIATGFKRVRHAEVMIIERLGKYKCTLKPGCHWTWPIIESPREINWRVMEASWNASSAHVKAYKTDRIDMREHVIDFGKQYVITKDTVRIEIDALVYFRITDPRVAVFRVNNLPDAVELLTQATLRDIIAQMTLDDTFSSREQINTLLLSQVQRDAERWGITITRVEIFNIMPPPDIARAMENQIKSERERRSVVLRADGSRESEVIRSRGEAAQTVLTAEGERASEVLRAKGIAEAKKLLAQAEAISLSQIRQAVSTFGNRGVDYLAAVEYLSSLGQMASSNTPVDLVMVPHDTIDSIGQMAGVKVGAE